MCRSGRGRSGAKNNLKKVLTTAARYEILAPQSPFTPGIPPGTNKAEEHMSNLFVIEDNVAIPARVLPTSGPRESKYPVDQLKEGQGFAIALGTYAGEGENETFTPFSIGSEEAEKQARQRQSQMSNLGGKRKIKLITRYFDGTPGNESPFKSTAAPCLGVWHGGVGEPRKRKSKKDAGDTAPQGEQNETATPAPPAAPADDVVTL